jgi:hypothetical protein
MLIESDGNELLLGDDGQLGNRRGLREHDALVDRDSGLYAQDGIKRIAHRADGVIDGRRATVQREKSDGRGCDQNQANAKVMLHVKTGSIRTHRRIPYFVPWSNLAHEREIDGNERRMTPKNGGGPLSGPKTIQVKPGGDPPIISRMWRVLVKKKRFLKTYLFNISLGKGSLLEAAIYSRWEESVSARANREVVLLRRSGKGSLRR